MKMNQSMSYMRYLSLVVLLLVSFVSFGQAPSNYTNINGRYRWIAGMFDSTFHIPKGTNPSLRTGGSTNAGALFYKTGDSSLYIYTGTQWLKIAGAAGFVPYSGATQNVNLGIYDILAKSATIADTGGTAATILQRTSINTDIALYAKAVGNRGFAAIIEQADSNATGTQYQTIFRKSMMPGTGNPAPGAGVSWYTQISNDNNNNPAVSVYRARIIDSTGYASGLINQTSTEFWTRKNNVWDTTLVLNGGNVGINTGQNGIDSALTVANGTWLKRGVRMSALPTGVGTKSVRIDANGNLSTTDTTATTGYVPYTGATQDLDMGTFSVNAKSFHIKGTAGQGHLGLKHQTATPSISANESGVYADVNGDLGLKNDNLYTSIFKTSLNSADRTYTFQNKSYTIADSADVAAKIGGTLISGYLTKATGTNTIDTSQIYQNNGRIGVSTTSPQTRLMVAETASDGALSILGNASNVGTFKFYANNGSTIQSVVNSSSSAMQIGTFVNSEMNLITNSATRVSILNNGNVGIGSGAATDSMLTVENGARFKRGVRMSALPTGVGTKALRIDANGTLSLADTLANGVSGTGTTNYIPKFTSSSAIGNSSITDNGSIVTATGYVFNVGGTTGSQFQLYGAFSSNLNLFQNYNTTGAVYTTEEHRAADYIYKIGTSEAMRLTSGGNLGIGTSAPSGSGWDESSTVLHIYKNAINGGLLKLESSNTTAILNAGNDQLAIFTTTNDPIRFGTNGSERMRLDASGNLIVGGTSDALTDVNRKVISLNGTSDAIISLRYGGSLNGFIWGNGSSAFQIASNNLPIVFSNGNAGGTERMRLDASGNLGLGTSSPTFSSGGGLQIANSTAAVLRLSRGANTGFDLIQGATENYIYGRDNFPIIFGTNNTERMRLDASGNLGLGVTPSAWLSGLYAMQITGVNGIYGAGSSELGLTQNAFFNSSSQWIYGTTNSAGSYQISSGVHKWLIAPSGTAGNAISFTQAMTLDASGRLGIGTTSPSDKLHVSGSGNTAIFVTGSGNTSYLQSVTSETRFGNLSSGGGAIVFQPADAERMRITSGGNVGIGTTSPGQLLDIRGASSSDGFAIFSGGSGSTKGGIYLGNAGLQYGSLWFDNATNDVVLRQNYSSGNLIFGTNSSERMRITSAGELLINTTSDAGDYKLQVNGNGYFSGNAAAVQSVEITNASASGFSGLILANTGTSGRTYTLGLGGNTSGQNGNFYIYDNTASATRFLINSSGNAEFGGSIKTAAPSGGTAAAWKLGERVASAGVTFNDQQYIQLDIGGTLYYLATVDLPMPEAYPQATSGPSNNYKMAPVQVKTTRDAEIEKLRKEIEELKQLIKNK